MSEDFFQYKSRNLPGKPNQNKLSRKKSDRKYIFRCLLVLETAILLYFSFLPASHVPQPGIGGVSLGAYVQHFIVYLVYGMLLVLVFCRPKSFGINNGILTALVLGSLFGLLNELIQGFVPTRSADLIDWFSDTIGAGAGGLITAKLFRRRLNQKLWGRN